VRRNEPKLISIVLGKLPAQFVRVVVAIDMNLLAFFAAASSDFRIAPLKIWPAAITDMPIIINVGAVNGLADDGNVARVFVNAAAAEVRIGAKIADINERVAVGADVASMVDPGANADVDLTSRFRR
jgi:hypothetical protein